MSGRVTIRCPKCKEWMTNMNDLCEDCKVTQIRIKQEEE